MPNPAVRSGGLPSLSLTSIEFLRYQSQRTGGSRGLVFGDQLWPYGAVAGLAERLARCLADRGCANRSRIVLRLPNSPLAVAGHYAAWAVGGTAVPVPVRATADELAQVLEDTQAEALVVDEDAAPLLEPTWRGRNLLVVSCGLTPATEPCVLQHRRALVERRGGGKPRWRLAVLAGTSGTTGTPKAVMLRHENLFWSALACSAARGDNGSEVGAALSLLSHTPVFVSHVLCRILLGATVVLFPRFDLEILLWATARYGISDLTLIGAMVSDVVQHGALPLAVQQAVRKVSVGGAFTPMEHKHRLRDLFPRAEVIEAYGQSEATNGVTMARGEQVFERPGTVGRQNPHVVVKIRKLNGEWAKPGEEGEIVVAGPTVMAGYWRDPRGTREALRDGWLHTGDLGRQDNEAFLYLTGRIKNLIISGGENVSPAEVEEVLRRHPLVAEVAVIGTPHPKWGEQVTAIVVPKEGAHIPAEAIMEFAGQHLAGFKKPRRVEFVPSLPRNVSNKVDLAQLRARYATAGPKQGGYGNG